MVLFTLPTALTHKLVNTTIVVPKVRAENNIGHAKIRAFSHKWKSKTSKKRSKRRPGNDGG